jgi:hypothetical protein
VTALREACYGLMCPKHGDCKEYWLCEGAASTVMFRATCATPQAPYEWPGFVPVTKEKEDAQDTLV